MAEAVDEPAVAGALNFRDVGGLPAAGGVTRHGVLFRSGNLARVGEEGRQELRRIGLRRIVDLRDDAEVAFEPTALGDLDVEMRRLPLFAGSAASFFEEDATLDRLYRSLVDESAAAMVEAARAVIAGPPTLVHCTVGKDRTGVTVALILAAAGVEEEAIVADYARTEQLLPADRNARVVAYLQRLHPESRNLVDLATRSPAEAMRALFAYLRGVYGAPAQFLAAHGLTPDEGRELRRILVAD